MAFHIREDMVINFAICWNSLVSISTFKSENLIGYAQSAGNLSFILLFLISVKEYIINTDKSSSETTRETSFNFSNYRKISEKSHNDISDS
jgi:hypothetical protein